MQTDFGIFLGSDVMEQKQYTLADARQMTLEDAKLAISRAVYEASSLLEKLEQAGKCFGNCHHARQMLSSLASAEIESRWKDKSNG
jgi:hypothetical protein